MIDSAKLNNHPQSAQSLDRLASKFGWSQSQLEQWLSSSLVAPHLRPWYNLCIRSPRRFAESVSWTRSHDDSPESGESRIKDGILRLCLAAHECDDHRYFKLVHAIDNIAFNTELWSCEEIWARTIWRIIQDSMLCQTDIMKMYAIDPAKPYKFAVEILWTMFTSIAFRSNNSLWIRFIEGVPEFMVSAVDQDEMRSGILTSHGTKRKGTKKRRRAGYAVSRNGRRPRHFLQTPKFAKKKHDT